MKGENNTSTYKPCGKGKVIWYKWHIGITLMVKETKGMDTPSHYMVGTQGPIIVRWAGKAWRANNDPHPTVERPGRQRPSPTRASTRTSRRVGISQEDLPHTRVTTSTLRMQEDYKEQHGSHSSNSWKKRFALWHRHAGMLTGSEPYKLRGIPSKGPQALMTRLGPSHERGPGTQPNIKYDSEFQSIYIASNITSTMSQCFLLKGGQIYGQDNDPNVLYSVSINRAVVQYYIHQQRVLQSVQLKGGQLLVTGQWP